MFRGSGAAPPPKTPSAPGRRSSEPEVVSTRPSRGLEQFFSYIRDQTGLSILDFAGATQSNVGFVTGLGHRIHTCDFLRSLDDTFGPDGLSEQANSGLIDHFVEQNLGFPEHSFDGVLAWDMMQYLSPALLNATIDRLHMILRPRSYLLAFFNADEKSLYAPSTTFRIEGQSSLRLSQHGFRKQGQVFNNRSLEKLFGQFESVKFFLTKENLREVIIKR